MKKQKIHYADELEKDFERWEHLKEFGGSDPFYEDGCNMNRIRNHIIYDKRHIEKTMNEPYPEIYYRETPPEADGKYMARKDEILAGAKKAYALYIADPNYRYLLEQESRLTKAQKEKTCITAVIGYARYLKEEIQRLDYVAMRRKLHTESYLKSFAKCAERVRKMPVEEMQLSFEI